MKSDDRRLKILEYVIDAYIRTGEPVGSATISQMLGGTVSSATVRNDMATLERLGFLQQPHASAGRVPTYVGYRLYIKKLMKPQPLSLEQKEEIDQMLLADTSSVGAIIDNAVNALAEVTGYVAVSTNNLPRFSVISKVEVVPAGYRLYAILLITSAGDIKNKICRMEFDLTDQQLQFFEDLLNRELLGITVDSLNPAMLKNLTAAMGSYLLSLSPLLYTLYQLSDEIAKRNVDVRGEGNLLKYSDFQTKELMQFLSAKEQIGHILTSAFSVINVVFGKETDTFAITNSSLVLSNYGQKQPIGSFGVIGPIRLDYAKVIPYVSYFSESVSRMIDKMLEEGRKGELDETGNGDRTDSGDKEDKGN